MTASPWAKPQDGAQPTAPVLPSPPPTPQGGPHPPGPPPPPWRGMPWLIVAAAVIVLVAVIAATATVTYAVTRNTASPVSTPPEPTVPETPRYGAAEQAAAKERVCKVFDLSVSGQKGQGGMRVNGELNVPLVVRTVNSVVAVQNALTPATPPDVVAVAKRYIDTSLDLTTAATGNVSVEEGNRLNDIANAAIFDFDDACGLPR